MNKTVETDMVIIKKIKFSSYKIWNYIKKFIIKADILCNNENGLTPKMPDITLHKILIRPQESPKRRDLHRIKPGAGQILKFQKRTLPQKPDHYITGGVV